jgi:glycosyltransferase involved in cell wall biosynthesis
MNALIRVALITQSYLPRVGGAERQIAEQAPLLRALGVELHVITRQYPGMAPFEVLGGVAVHRLPTPGPKAAASAAFTLGALPLLRRIRPDVLHAFSLFSPATTALLARRLCDAPVVVKVLRGGSHGDLVKLRRGRLGEARMALLRRQVSAFIAISREIDSELAQAGVPAARRPFIPNGVDTARFAPLPPAARAALRRTLGLGPEPVVVFTGRLNAEKHVGLLVELWPAIRAHLPDATLLLVGTGYQEAELRARAGAGIRFTGRVDDVAPFLRAADVFVLPSAAEGLSNALLEAMSTGVVPLATAVGGALDLIEDGRNGALVPPGDAAALRERLLALLTHEGERQEMGRRARARVVREYALPAVATRLRTLYDCVIAHRPFGWEQTRPVEG